jgi:hypothetical protein
MVVDDFDVKRVALFKSKTYAPLIIDTDAPLPLAIAFIDAAYSEF